MAGRDFQWPAAPQRLGTSQMLLKVEHPSDVCRGTTMMDQRKSRVGENSELEGTEIDPCLTQSRIESHKLVD